jgi:hypothetical protein
MAFALEALRQSHARKLKQSKRGRKHTDDSHDLVITPENSADPTSALLDLTAQSYADRKQYDAGEKVRVELASAGERSPEDTQSEAERASQAHVADMKKKGVKLREHYYSATERSQTGEIDRTYDAEVDGKKKEEK